MDVFWINKGSQTYTHIHTHLLSIFTQCQWCILLFHRLQSASPHPHPPSIPKRATLLPRGSWLAWIGPRDSSTLAFTHITVEQGGVYACICNEEGTLRFTVLAPGLVKWVDCCHFPHQHINVPCFVFLFKKPMKRISRMRK